MLFKKRNEIRELKEKNKEYLKLIDHKDSQIISLRSQLNEMIEFREKDKEKINLLKKENCKSLNVTKEIVKKLEEKELARKRLACSKGGQVLAIKRLEKQIKELELILKKREMDYLFALKVLFRRVRMTTDTKAFLSQRMKELLKKYEYNRGDNYDSDIRK